MPLWRPRKPGDAALDAVLAKILNRPAIVDSRACQVGRKLRCTVASAQGELTMQILEAPTAELDRLGDEIAELSAHLEAATARLLDLIREFDVRGGWNSGFRSCAAWLNWRVGLDMGAAREHVRVARSGRCPW
jgi:hypothetical protein